MIFILVSEMNQKYNGCTIIIIIYYYYQFCMTDLYEKCCLYECSKHYITHIYFLAVHFSSWL